MSLRCMQCNAEVQSHDAKCPSCSAPETALKPVATTVPRTPVPPREPSSQESAKPGKLLWVVLISATILLLVFGAVTRSNSVEVVSMRIQSYLLGAPDVTATLHNSGPGTRLRYYLTKSGSDTPLCEGHTYFAANERRTLKFDCPALIGYNGDVRLMLD